MSTEDNLRTVKLRFDPLLQTWLSLQDKEIQQVIDVFIAEGWIPPAGQERTVQTAEHFFDAFKAELDDYIGDAIKTNEFDETVYHELLHRAKIAAGLELE